VSFLIKGHTHFDPDQVFSRVSERLKVMDALCASQFRDHLKQVLVHINTISYIYIAVKDSRRVTSCVYTHTYVYCTILYIHSR
jgi:hypothetical protein